MPLCDCKFLVTGNIFTELKNLIKSKLYFQLFYNFLKVQYLLSSYSYDAYGLFCGGACGLYDSISWGKK